MYLPLLPQGCDAGYYVWEMRANGRKMRRSPSRGGEISAEMENKMFLGRRPSVGLSYRETASLFWTEGEEPQNKAASAADTQRSKDTITEVSRLS